MSVDHRQGSSSRKVSGSATSSASHKRGLSEENAAAVKESHPSQKKKKDGKFGYLFSNRCSYLHSNLTSADGLDSIRLSFATPSRTADEGDDAVPHRWQTPAELSLAAYQSKLKASVDAVAEIRKNLLKLQDNFAAIIKCLTILLDSELMDVAVLGSSYARQVACYHIHKYLNLDDESVVDALDRFNEIKSAEGAPKPDIGQEDFDFVKENKKLQTLLRSSNSQIVNGRSTLESRIDNFLEEQFTDKPTKDLQILFEWFDGVAPP